MKNCMEWVIAEQAIFCISGATVPFYDTLGPDSVGYILEQTGTPSVVCSRAEIQRLCAVKKSGQCPRFQIAILVDGVTPEAANMAKDAGLQVMSFAKKARTRLAIVLALILSVASGLVLPSTIYFAFCLGALDGWLSHLSLPPLTLSLGVVICRSIFGSHGGSK